MCALYAYYVCALMDHCFYFTQRMFFREPAPLHNSVKKNAPHERGAYLWNGDI